MDNIRRLIQMTPTVSFVVTGLFSVIVIYFLFWLLSHPDFIEAWSAARGLR